MTGRHESDAGAVTGMEAATIRDQARRLVERIDEGNVLRPEEGRHGMGHPKECLLCRAGDLLRVVAE